MKVTRLTASIIFSLLILSSCKKDNNNNPSSKNKLKYYIEDTRNVPGGTLDTFTVTYDAQGRLTGLSSPAISTVYTYSSGSSFTLDLYNGNVLDIHEILYLNSQQYVDSTFQFDNTNDTTTEKYTYSGNRLTKLVEYAYSSVYGSYIDSEDDYTYDATGNMTTDLQTDGVGNVSTTTYTYTSQSLNISTQPFYFPLPSAKLPATMTVADGYGDINTQVTFTYEFDSQGRVTKQTSSDSVSGYVISKSYVYQ